MKRALFIGRFQPFHKGHLESVKRILKSCDEVMVAVGSAQESHESLNLFTLGERIEMVYESVKEEGLAAQCLVVGIPDINYNALWAKHLMVLSPSFDVVYSNNALVRRLFREEGVKVRPLKLVERKEFDGTFIRKLMLKGDKWKKLLPPAAVKVAVKAKAVQRLREINGGDKA
jgi:nicotinamide-nucleotide adenylyltransferase